MSVCSQTEFTILADDAKKFRVRRDHIGASISGEVRDGLPYRWRAAWDRSEEIGGVWHAFPDGSMYRNIEMRSGRIVTVLAIPSND